jgi:hypothetical protein
MCVRRESRNHDRMAESRQRSGTSRSQVVERGVRSLGVPPKLHSDRHLLKDEFFAIRKQRHQLHQAARLSRDYLNQAAERSRSRARRKLSKAGVLLQPRNRPGLHQCHHHGCHSTRCWAQSELEACFRPSRRLSSLSNLRSKVREATKMAFPLWETKSTFTSCRVEASSQKSALVASLILETNSICFKSATVPSSNIFIANRTTITRT